MRLDNLVSKALLISRKDAKKLIAKSKITVNQTVERLRNRQINTSDQVLYNNELLTFPSNKYLMLNKPKGYICSSVDESQPSALNLINGLSKLGLHFAGRLDADTTGLVLISDDGQWTHHISAPSGKQGKTYLVNLAEEVKPEQIQQLKQGIILKDSEKETLPAIVELTNSHQVRLTIYEGRYHQVKRMFAAIGNHVVALHRESIGTLKIDCCLKAGDWRAMTEQEIELLSDYTN